MAREPEKGLASIAEALTGIETSGQHMHEAELWRLCGELLVLHRDAEAEAERSFHHALKVAQGQQARSWELRATMSLARLLASQGKRAEARCSPKSTAGSPKVSTPPTSRTRRRCWTS
jgi:predicted ATPase